MSPDMSNEKDDCDPSATSAEVKLKRVQQWLDKAGYPLEMRVARAFAMHDRVFSRVAMGDVYESHERAGTYRAIDVTAVSQVSEAPERRARPRAASNRG